MHKNKQNERMHEGNMFCEAKFKLSNENVNNLMM